MGVRVSYATARSRVTNGEKNKLYAEDRAVHEWYRFPVLICRSIAAQFMANDVIAMFEFEEDESGVAIAAEKHYRLVPPEQVTEIDLSMYRDRPL